MSGSPLSGQVVGPRGAVSDAVVEVWYLDELVEVAKCDTDGKWRTSLLSAGRYDLIARKARHATSAVVSVDHDGVAPRECIAIPVEFGAVVRVRVDEEPQEVIVSLTAVARDEYGTTHDGKIREDGTFEFEGLPSGAYEIVVSGAHGYSGRKEIQVSLGERQSINLKIDHGLRYVSRWSDDVPNDAGLTGRVTLSGVTVPSFVIALRKGPPGSWWTDPVLVVDPCGRFTLRDVAAVRCQVMIMGLGTGIWSRVVNLVSGRVLDCGEVKLQHGARITGTVHDAAGRPVAGASVSIGTWTSHETPLWNAAHGAYHVESDALGRFEFAGVAVSGAVAQIFAAHVDYGKSHMNEIGNCDERLDLRLFPVADSEK